MTGGANGLSSFSVEGIEFQDGMTVGSDGIVDVDMIVGKEKDGRISRPGKPKSAQQKQEGQLGG